MFHALPFVFSAPRRHGGATPPRPTSQARIKLAWPTAALVFAVVLSGCAIGPQRLTTDVQAFAATHSKAPIAWQGARYRFDVLPSQQGLNLAPLHAMTEAALARRGLVRSDEAARYAVQVSASARTAWVQDGWALHPGMHPWGPWGGWGWGIGVGRGWSGSVWGAGHFPPTSTHWRELRLAIVDGQTQQTVYETRARAESPSQAHDAIFETMLEAALQDFPHSTAGWVPVVSDVRTDAAAPSGHKPLPAAAADADPPTAVPVPTGSAERR